MKIGISDKTEFIGQLIDTFEDFLTERGVLLPNTERQEAAMEEDPESIAIIYGSDYDELSDEIEKVLNGWQLITPESGKEPLKLDMSEGRWEQLEITVPEGRWKVDMNFDYPGIDIEFFQNDKPEEIVTRPRICWEFPNELSDEMSAYVWADPLDEDYTGNPVRFLNYRKECGYERRMP